MQLVRKSRIILIVLIMLLSLGLSQVSQKEIDQKLKQLEKTQNNTFAAQLEATEQITEFTVRNEYVKKTERENVYLKVGYLLIIIRYIAVGV